MWVSRAHYRLLLKQLAAAEQRAESLAASLDIERHENRRAERHWSNILLRARQMGGMPLSPTEPAAPVTPTDSDDQLTLVPMDPGELEAHIAEGKRMGVERAEVINLLRERGYTVPL